MKMRIAHTANIVKLKLLTSISSMNAKLVVRKVMMDILKMTLINAYASIVKRKVTLEMIAKIIASVLTVVYVTI